MFLDLCLVLSNGSSLGDVDTVQELSDILVSHSGDLLNVSSRLGDVLQRVASEDQLVLLGSGDLHSDTFQNIDSSHLLLSQEVSDLDHGSIVQNIDVDREMGIDISHLVLESLGDTSDHIGDQRLDSSQSGSVFSVSVVYSDSDLFVRHFLEGNVDMSQVLVQGASGTSNGDLSGLDLDNDSLGDVENFVGLDIFHGVDERLD